ncbi:lipid droplet-associated protein [Rhodococcus sp. 14C212]|uniref:lipid droplet-associated protein n=1 Tax=Rhodococcus sp. 14C212 TaxID=2711209 RepID=UPI0013EA4E8E|nr:lipid droplet-associated protein [Rhodococcus sp. 14C212]NGP04746.1 lipid droplet-associated protein [Rhodococcus sp. 14C212]
MIRPPFMARVAAGLAVTAYEETLKLPSTAVALPMTTVSQILQTTMRIQQTMTSLAIKGDQLFELLGAPPAEEPSWATFDDDLEASAGTGEVSTAAAPGRFALYSMPPAAEAAVPMTAAPKAGKSAATETETAGSGAPGTGSPAESTAAKISAGKTAVGGGDAAGGVAAKAPAKKTAKKTAAESAAGSEVPEIVELLDYPSLTLAQLRARMRTLSVEDLRALLEYESATRARDPFETMLSNRIANASTK